MRRPSCLVALAVRVYRAAARLLPPDFRREYGAELIDCFTDIAAEAHAGRGPAGVLAVTVRAIADLATRAPRQHLAAARARTIGGGGGMSGWWLDVRHAARRLRRRPAFTAAAVLTLGLGLGAATAVFTLVHSVVLSPLPYPESRRLVEVDHAGPGVGADRGLGITYGFYRFYAATVRGAEAWAMHSPLEQTLVGAGDPVRLSGTRVTVSLGDVLTVPAAVGRWFTADEGRPGSALTVILSDRLWRERFDGDASVIGRSIDLGGVPREVVGVMPASFAFPSTATMFWIPRVVPATGVGGWNEQAVARLAAGTDPAGLAAEILARYPALRADTSDPARVRAYLDEARVTPLVTPLRDSLIAGVRLTLWVLLATVGTVLLIAVANVGNLFLIRADAGHREMAVRAALGAGRGRVIRTVLIEGLLLAGAAGALGLTAAAGAVRLVQARAPVPVPRLEEAGLSAPVVLAALAATALAGFALGLLPVLGRGRHAGDAALRGRARWATDGVASRRGRDVLMAAQVALALVLLVGSGLLFRTYGELRAVDLGFSQRQALVFDLGLPETRYRTPAEMAAFHDRLLETLRGLPGVTSAAAIGQCLPLSGNMCWGETLDVEGQPAPAGQLPPVTGARIATADYFRTLGIRVRGRAFTPEDARTVGAAAILSEAAAAAYFPAGDPIGRRVRFGSTGAWHTVVGVADDVAGALGDNRFSRTIYLPVFPEAADGPPPGHLVYVLRTAVAPASLVPAVRARVAEHDALLPLADVHSLQEHIDRATAPTAFALALIGLAAAIALVLGMVGVYAVVAYAVSRRTAEIGLRMAIGASPAQVARLIMRQGGRVIVAGAAVGLVAALSLSGLAEGLLFGVSSTDAISYAAVTGLLLAVATAALWLPARRAARVDPATALRGE